MTGLPLLFTAPLVLMALAALPALWFLLRVTPPAPQKLVFPALKIMEHLPDEQPTRARTPWPLLLMRLILLGLLILAASGPIWNPQKPAFSLGKGPVLVIVDNGATAAPDWDQRLQLLRFWAEQAEQQNTLLAVLATGTPSTLDFLPIDETHARLRSLEPQAFIPQRSSHLATIKNFAKDHPDATLIWISDGISLESDKSFATDISSIFPSQRLHIFQNPTSPLIMVAGMTQDKNGLQVTLVRTSTARSQGVLRGFKKSGELLTEHEFAFESDRLETLETLQLPLELINQIARFEIVGQRSAASVGLLDGRNRRSRIGLIDGGSDDKAQPLLSPLHYVSRALSPFAEIMQGRGSTADAIAAMINNKASMLVLTDIGAMDSDTTHKLTQFVEEGGVLVRFSGSKLAASTGASINDSLLPVTLRRGGRELNGALSWDAPKTLAPFPQNSPFSGLNIPNDLGIKRQILAEPTPDLSDKSLASLQDGTPIVTAKRQGQGWMILFHVTADAGWSNLPLSGLFVDMLNRLTPLSQKNGSEPIINENTRLMPVQVLNGFGDFISPPAFVKPLDHPQPVADISHPAGSYGTEQANVALNVLDKNSRITAITSSNASPVHGEAAHDLRPALLLTAFLLLCLDSLVMLWLRGTRGFHWPVKALFLTAILLPCLPQPTLSASRDAISNAAKTRLAYIVTGDKRVDDVTLAGLKGLSLALSERTALEPDPPIGLDLERNDLSFYPLIYWGISAQQLLPNAQALRKLDLYFKNGGTILFDTRDALLQRPDQPPSETLALRRLLATLNIPQLEPVPKDHVLRRTFYLLDQFSGRYNTGTTWVEANMDNGAARGDGVSPVIMTSNDLASAWAVDSYGEALFSIGSLDMGQRETALRAGINIVLYSLTGNYKADQVHAPALLKRLGE